MAKKGFAPILVILIVALFLASGTIYYLKKHRTQSVSTADQAPPVASQQKEFSYVLTAPSKDAEWRLGETHTLAWKPGPSGLKGDIHAYDVSMAAADHYEETMDFVIARDVPLDAGSVDVLLSPSLFELNGRNVVLPNWQQSFYLSIAPHGSTGYIQDENAVRVYISSGP